MNNMNTPKPIEPSVGNRYQVDSTLSDIYLSVANCPPFRPDFKPCVERHFRRIAAMLVEIPAVAH